MGFVSSGPFVSRYPSPAYWLIKEVVREINRSNVPEDAVTTAVKAQSLLPVSRVEKRILGGMKISQDQANRYLI